MRSLDQLNLNFIVHYSNLHLPPLFSSPMLVTGLFWLVTSAGYPGFLALNCGCTVFPFVSSLTSSLRYETLIIHTGQGFLIVVPLLCPRHPLRHLFRCHLSPWSRVPATELYKPINKLTLPMPMHPSATPNHTSHCMREAFWGTKQVLSVLARITYARPSQFFAGLCGCQT